MCHGIVVSIISAVPQISIADTAAATVSNNCLCSSNEYYYTHVYACTDIDMFGLDQTLASTMEMSVFPERWSKLAFLPYV